MPYLFISHEWIASKIYSSRNFGIYKREGVPNREQKEQSHGALKHKKTPPALSCNTRQSAATAKTQFANEHRQSGFDVADVLDSLQRFYNLCRHFLVNHVNRNRKAALPDLPRIVCPDVNFVVSK